MLKWIYFNSQNTSGKSEYCFISKYPEFCWLFTPHWSRIIKWDLLANLCTDIYQWSLTKWLQVGMVQRIQLWGNQWFIGNIWSAYDLSIMDSIYGSVVTLIFPNMVSETSQTPDNSVGELWGVWTPNPLWRAHRIWFSNILQHLVHEGYGTGSCWVSPLIGNRLIKQIWVYVKDHPDGMYS